MTMPGKDSRWRAQSRRIIEGVIREYPTPTNGDEFITLFYKVSKAYPFGQRKLHPYKMWCYEVKIARAKLANEVFGDMQLPLTMPCASCGARMGMGCKPIGAIQDDLMVADDAELEGRDADAKTIRDTTFHHARLVAVGIVPAEETGELPLFSRTPT